MPFAVVAYADVKDRAAGEDRLQNVTVPGAKALPGFVRGLWMWGDDSTGLAVVVLESREAAESAAAAARERMDAQSLPGVSLTRIEIREVVAEA